MPSDSAAEIAKLREAIRDQGGTREWSFRCAVRRRAGGFDDAGLFRFAASFATRAERLSPARLLRLSEALLEARGSRDVIVLGLRRRGRDLELDLYNTAPRPRTVKLVGTLTEGRGVNTCGLLGGEMVPCPGGAVVARPQTYTRVVLSESPG